MGALDLSLAGVKGGEGVGAQRDRLLARAALASWVCPMLELAPKRHETLFQPAALTGRPASRHGDC